MLSMESMIAISSRRGGGGRQTFPVPLSKEKRIPTPVCALARNDTENFQVLSLRGRTAPVAIRNILPRASPRVQAPPGVHKYSKHMKGKKR